MNKLLIVSVLPVTLLSVTVTSISAQSKYEIPAWVKGVAGFWSEGKITNDEFGDGLSFLIDNNIIKVPKIKELESENTKLQSKNTQPIQNPTTDTDRCLVPPKPNIDLHGCILISSYLYNADLSGANFSGANLSDSDLGGANLSGANLQNTNLSGARLDGANLSGANLSGANLSGANLNGVYFSGVYFSGGVQNLDSTITNFNGANLSGITFTGCIGSVIGTPSVGTLPICMMAP